MAEKISADEMREKDPEELNDLVTDLQKELTQATTPEIGSGVSNPANPSEDIGTIKRNIARAKTVLNEKLDHQVN